MKQPNEEGFSLLWHVVRPWLDVMCANPIQGRSLLGKLVRDHGRDAVILAFDRTLEAHPRPADPFTYFIKLASSNTRQLGDAQSAWNTVMRLAANSGDANGQASSRINQAVAFIGGWAKIGFADQKKLGQLRQMFVEAYNEMPT